MRSLIPTLLGIKGIVALDDYHKDCTRLWSVCTLHFCRTWELGRDKELCPEDEYWDEGSQWRNRLPDEKEVAGFGNRDAVEEEKGCLKKAAAETLGNRLCCHP